MEVEIKICFLDEEIMDLETSPNEKETKWSSKKYLKKSRSETCHSTEEAV